MDLVLEVDTLWISGFTPFGGTLTLNGFLLGLGTLFSNGFTKETLRHAVTQWVYSVTLTRYFHSGDACITYSILARCHLMGLLFPDI